MRAELTARIEALMAQNSTDEDAVIKIWYQSFNRPPEHDMVPMSPLPSPEKMWRLFEDWFSEVKRELAKNLCPEWNLLKAEQEDLITAGCVASITSLLSQIEFSGPPVDFAATSLILMSKGYLNDLCSGASQDGPQDY